MIYVDTLVPELALIIQLWLYTVAAPLSLTGLSRMSQHMNDKQGVVVACAHQQLLLVCLAWHKSWYKSGTHGGCGTCLQVCIALLVWV